MRVRALPERAVVTPASVAVHTHTHTHTQGFDLVPEDSVVPHTPVLNEGKQLAMGNRIQTLP